MELIVLNSDLEAINILDTFESLIWTDRYNSFGDFEIYTTASEEMLNILRPDYYLTLKESEHVMIIEGCQIKEDIENGDRMIFTGRSLESILDRRIIWNQTMLTGNLQNGIEKLLIENIIAPSISDRFIPKFVFEWSTDPAITSLTIDTQFTGDNLYEAIKKICDLNNIGFKITLSEDNHFIFKLYSGANRSYDQMDNPYIVFSPKFGNIFSSSYLKSISNIKNVTLVAGEGEGLDRKNTTVGTGSSISRRELYTDARDLSQTVDGVLLSDDVYNTLLTNRGNQKLSEYKLIESFDGQVDSLGLFRYGEDFYMGDIVQIVSRYDIGGKARVTELIHSQNTSSISIYPTFTMIE